MFRFCLICTVITVICDATPQWWCKMQNCCGVWTSYFSSHSDCTLFRIIFFLVWHDWGAVLICLFKYCHHIKKLAKMWGVATSFNLSQHLITMFESKIDPKRRQFLFFLISDIYQLYKNVSPWQKLCKTLQNLCTQYLPTKTHCKNDGTVCYSYAALMSYQSYCNYLFKTCKYLLC